jgi:hypothetical protein
VPESDCAAGAPHAEDDGPREAAALPDFGLDSLLLSARQVSAGTWLGEDMAAKFDRDRKGGRAMSRLALRFGQGAAAMILLAASLSACGTISEETAAKAAFAPGRFDLYTCGDLDNRLKEVRKKQVELEQLMARAEQDAGGAFVSAIAYRSEYTQTRGELVELNKAANDRQCAIGNKYSSGRAIF